MPSLPVIRLAVPDAERYARLRARMLGDAPWAFASSPEDDIARDLDRLRAILAADQNAIVAVESDSDREELIAAAGIVRETNVKSSHRSKLWGVYVEPSYRGRGLGRAVVSAALGLARTWKGVDYVDLGVSENSPAAGKLYQDLGFIAWGREPESLQCEDRRFDEIFMCVRL